MSWSSWSWPGLCREGWTGWSLKISASQNFLWFYASITGSLRKHSLSYRWNRLKLSTGEKWPVGKEKYGTPMDTVLLTCIKFSDCLLLCHLMFLYSFIEILNTSMKHLKRVDSCCRYLFKIVLLLLLLEGTLSFSLEKEDKWPHASVKILLKSDWAFVKLCE